MGEIIGKLTIDAGKKLLQTVLDELIRRGAIWLADRIEKLFSAATERFGRKAQLPKEISEQITRIDRDVRSMSIEQLEREIRDLAQSMEKYMD